MEQPGECNNRRHPERWAECIYLIPTWKRVVRGLRFLEPSVHSDAFTHIKPDTLLGVGDSNNNTDDSQCFLSSSYASDKASEMLLHWFPPITPFIE